MKIEIEIGTNNKINRTVRVTIAPDEIKSVALNIAFPKERNRTGLYIRRHQKPTDRPRFKVEPNAPLRFSKEPKKLSIHEHLKEMGFGTNASFEIPAEGSERYRTIPTLIAVPVSDVAANLLRPCFSRIGFDGSRIFFFEDEPIRHRFYWAVCFFSVEGSRSELKFMDIKFDVSKDCVYSLDGQDLVQLGLEWAVCLVPLVKNSKAISVQEIAQNNYDLRQIFGRNAAQEFFSPYDVWDDGWDERVAEVIQKHIEMGIPFETYYHSILGIDSSGAVRIYQIDCILPDIAEKLVGEGIIAAGLLDSGGSCALYDAWIGGGGYLNHGWYFREPRGAILAFELMTFERIGISGNKTSVKNKLSGF